MMHYSKLPGKGFALFVEVLINLETRLFTPFQFLNYIFSNFSSLLNDTILVHVNFYMVVYDRREYLRLGFQESF